MKRPRIEDVLVAVRGAFESKGWHGPAALESLEGVTPRQAARRPARAHHTIHELVDHIAYWEAAGIDYVRRGTSPPRLDPDWRRPSRDFAASVRRLKATHGAFVEHKCVTRSVRSVFIPVSARTCGSDPACSTHAPCPGRL